MPSIVLVPAIATVVSAFATRSLWATGMVGFSTVAAVFLASAVSGGGQPHLYAGAGAAALLVPCVAGAVHAGVFRIDPSVELKLWRVLARPFALLFIPIEIRFGNRALLVLVGIVAAVFIVTDLARIFSRLHSERIYKTGERKRFSSMTAFLVSVFVVFLLFSPPISYLSLAFLTVGDLYGKLIGIRFGRTKLFERRSLEGSMGFATGCLVAGQVIHVLLPYPIAYLFAGAVAATLVELFSKDIDDNLTVGLLSGVTLSVMRRFFGI